MSTKAIGQTEPHLKHAMHRENGDYIILGLWLRPFVPFKDRGCLPFAGVDGEELI